jgi:hypothetical protein
VKFRKKQLPPVQFGAAEDVSVQPGFKLHCAVFDSISDHLHNLHLDPNQEVLIIEVGAGFGLLAKVILPSIAKEFPDISFRYTGIEIDSDRSALISSSLEKCGNVRIINDDYKNFNDHIPQNVAVILLGTGLIQCLELEEIRCMLTLNIKSSKHFGVFTFPLNIAARGNLRIPPGNVGCAERSFTELTKDLKAITKSENFSDTTLQFLEVLEESNVLFSFNYSREKS